MFSKLFQKKNKSVDLDTHSYVIRLIKEILESDHDGTPIEDHTYLEHLGFDSIKFINLMLSLEDYIKKDLEQIAEEIDISSLKKVKDLVEVIEKLKA